MKKLLSGAALAAALAFVTQASAVNANKSIKDVMGEGHKGKPALCAKANQGKASKAECETLLSLYEDLAKNKPPRGSEADWKKRTNALVSATKKLVADPANSKAIGEYKTAVNCKGCHDAHK
jgi:hypothetical protein